MQAGKQKKYLVVVEGPTAVGKTDFSIRLAKALDTVILSADSRQLYKELTIGTAKPSAEELRQVPHYFIDMLPPTVPYDAGQYERDALSLLNSLYTKHTAVVLTGGSGLYVRALCQGFDAMPEVEEGIRNKLNQLYQEQGLAPLLAELQQADPDYFARVDRQNPQRVIRALEVCRASGKPYSSFRKQVQTKRPFETIKLALDRPRPELYARIDARMDAMLAEGLEEEARRLYPFRSLNALQTVGYQELFAYFEGAYDYEEAVRLLKRNTRRYAKRQLTWLRADENVNWFHPDDFERALAWVRAKISGVEESGGS
jgi:tRNA dimethylallyltransferase